MLKPPLPLRVFALADWWLAGCNYANDPFQQACAMAGNLSTLACIH